MAGTLTRDQFVTEICDIIKKSVSSLSVSSAELQTRVQARYLNFGQIRIARRYSFNELDKTHTGAVTVADLKTYPLSSGDNNLGLTRPKDIASIRLIDGANSRTLTRTIQRTFDQEIPDPTQFTTDRPSIYIRYGNNLELFRIPNDAYTLHIRYPQWPTAFSTSSQTSDFDEKDDLVLVAGVLETMLALQETKLAAYWEGKFETSLLECIRAIGDIDWEPKGEPFGVGTMTTSGSPWTDPFADEGDPLYGME